MTALETHPLFDHLYGAEQCITVSVNSRLSVKHCCRTYACRGLEGMLSQRRKLLQYLRQSDFDAYTVLLVRLGLKDNYAKQVCPKH
jgi:hypothetical protein